MSDREPMQLSEEELVRRRQNLSHNLDQFFQWMQRPDVRAQRSEMNMEALRYMGFMLSPLDEFVKEAEEIANRSQEHG